MSASQHLSAVIIGFFTLLSPYINCIDTSCAKLLKSKVKYYLLHHTPLSKYHRTSHSCPHFPEHIAGLPSSTAASQLLKTIQLIRFAYFKLCADFNTLIVGIQPDLNVNWLNKLIKRTLFKIYHTKIRNIFILEAWRQKLIWNIEGLPATPFFWVFGPHWNLTTCHSFRDKTQWTYTRCLLLINCTAATPGISATPFTVSFIVIF